MKPLTTANVDNLLDRIFDAEGGILRSIAMNGPTTCTVTLSVQDENRGNDWINIAFEVNGISDAHLIDDAKFGLVDMDDGISIIYEDKAVSFAFGDYGSIEASKGSIVYMIGASIKYEEQPFSE
jgi:hypothetical protein